MRALYIIDGIGAGDNRIQADSLTEAAQIAVDSIAAGADRFRITPIPYGAPPFRSFWCEKDPDEAGSYRIYEVVGRVHRKEESE